MSVIRFDKPGPPCFLRSGWWQARQEARGYEDPKRQEQFGADHAAKRALAPVDQVDRADSEDEHRRPSFMVSARPYAVSIRLDKLGTWRKTLYTPVTTMIVTTMVATLENRRTARTSTFSRVSAARREADPAGAEESEHASHPHRDRDDVQPIHKKGQKAALGCGPRRGVAQLGQGRQRYAPESSSRPPIGDLVFTGCPEHHQGSDRRANPHRMSQMFPTRVPNNACTMIPIPTGSSK